MEALRQQAEGASSASKSSTKGKRGGAVKKSQPKETKREEKLEKPDAISPNSLSPKSPKKLQRKKDTPFPTDDAINPYEEKQYAPANIERFQTVKSFTGHLH